MPIAVIVSVLCLAALNFAPDTGGTSDAPRVVRWELSTESIGPIDDGLLERWDKRAGEAQSLVEQFDARLAAANWILSRQISAPVSRTLLQIEEAGDAKRIADEVSIAILQLEKAERIWADVIKSGELPDADGLLRARNLSGLKAFAEVFLTLWPESKPSSDAREGAMRSAANRLSILLDYDEKAIAATAQLWQGYIHVRREKLDRALDIWPRTLEPLSEPRGVGLYTRLMQCRTVVQKDQSFVAGVALLLNLEAVAVRRIADARKSIEAQAAIALVRRQFLTKWRQQFENEGQLDRAAWCSHTIEALDVAHDPGGGVVAVLPMEFAAPEFVDLDKAIARLDEPVNDPKVSQREKKVAPKSSDDSTEDLGMEQENESQDEPGS